MRDSPSPVHNKDLRSSPDDQTYHEDFPEISKVSSLWALVTANISSFSAQQNVLLDIPFDVAALQEARRTARPQRGFS